MRGIFATARSQVGVLEIPEPEPGPYEALVEVEACGICNSTDWKLLKGEFVSGSYPILLGHESVGRVVELGSKVRSFHPGDLVLRTTLRDEHIPHPGGRSCWGGFAERAIVTDVWAEKGVEYNAFPHPQQVVPPGIGSVHAVAMVTLKETLSCLENTDVQAGHSLAIVGTGPVAQALTRLARLLGIAPVVVFGRQAAWGELFAKLGAHDYAAGDDAPPEVRKILVGGGFDRVIEAVGSPSALSRCLHIAKVEGRVNTYGVTSASEPYAPAQEADGRVFRSRVAEAEVHEKLCQWVEQGEIRLSDWITDVLPWIEHQRGLDLVKENTSCKVVLTFATT